MKIYELFTSDGCYEDYREYILYRNTDIKTVEEVKTKIESAMSRIAKKELKGITVEDLELYESNDYEKLSDEKWNLIYDQKQKEYKIQGLSRLQIVEKDFNNKPVIKDILAIIGL